MVEGARLESVCMRKCTEGSNPSLSATLWQAQTVFMFSRHDTDCHLGRALHEKAL